MNTNFKLILILFTTLLSLSCNTKQQSKQNDQSGKITLLTPEEFKNKSLNQVVIDIRTPQEFSQGHIEDAININYYDRNFLEKIAKYDKSKSIFLYCRSGNRSSSASSKLSELGFEQVYDLKGGIINWSRNNYQIIQE